VTTPRWIHLVAAASDSQLTRDEGAQLRDDAKAVLQSLTRENFREIAKALAEVVGVPHFGPHRPG
jgi:hypothetical protein